jgi:7-carboxy-7-deazaguanine synthase
MFLRLANCNLDCAWCDTPFSWDWKGRNGVVYDRATEVTERTPEELARRFDGESRARIVITGGEPLLQQEGILALLDLLDPSGRAVEIETNGTIRPRPELLTRAIFNVSPKLAHSGIPEERRIRRDVLETFAPVAWSCFKVVCRNAEDVAEAGRLLFLDLDTPPERIWVMPEGSTTADVLAHTPEVTEAAIAWGFNVSPRLHVLAWGNERGR